VTVEGPVIVEPAVDFARDVREMALRYLGPQVGEAYLASMYPNGTSSEMLVRLRPERWATVDFRKLGGG
jgi:hypothetical protein